MLRKIKHLLFGPPADSPGVRRPRFVLKRSENGQYHWSLKAANNEIIATSEQYESRAGALSGIYAVKDDASRAHVVQEL